MADCGHSKVTRGRVVVALAVSGVAAVVMSASPVDATATACPNEMDIASFPLQCEPVESLATTVAPPTTVAPLETLLPPETLVPAANAPTDTREPSAPSTAPTTIVILGPATVTPNTVTPNTVTPDTVTPDTVTPETDTTGTTTTNSVSPDMAVPNQPGSPPDPIDEHPMVQSDAPTRTPPSPLDATLPATGSATSVLLLIGACGLLAGAAMLAMSRRQSACNSPAAES